MRAEAVAEAAVDCIEEARRELVRNAVPGYALKKMVLNIGG